MTLSDELLPFFSESQGESFEELSCFSPNQPIGGDNKRSEVLVLFETGLRVLLLFLGLLLYDEDLVGDYVTGMTWCPYLSHERQQ
jgi:hypothetical protein